MNSLFNYITIEFILQLYNRIPDIHFGISHIKMQYSKYHIKAIYLLLVFANLSLFSWDADIRNSYIENGHEPNHHIPFDVSNANSEITINSRYKLSVGGFRMNGNEQNENDPEILDEKSDVVVEVDGKSTVSAVFSLLSNAHIAPHYRKIHTARQG